MNILTVDFETYFTNGDLGFKKQTTEEYVRDPRFHVIGVSVQVDGGKPEWFSGNYMETYEFLKKFDWANSMAVAHNAMFDMAILSWHYNIKPMAIGDTLSMARAIHGTEVGGSLHKLTQHYGLGQKGDDTLWAINLKREDFTEEQLAQYGRYCMNDVALTYKLFIILLNEMLAASSKKTELKLIDTTIRMFTEPVLRLDPELLEKHLVEVRDRKAKSLAAAGCDLEDLMSNKKFAEVLRNLGVEPPMKISLTTGKETLALAKSDEGFKALAEHPDERVQALVAARLGNKTTLEETRTERLIGIATRGLIPVPLAYYAAHTGRWGGSDKLNFQNFPSRGENAGVLKKAILAPEDHVIIDCDSSQIEARVLAWFAGQTDLVEAFANGEDVYKIMASAIYNKSREEVTTQERFVGKTTILGCISEGTLVLSDSGWKPIERVTLEDKLWDGEEWVCHQGLQNSGTKETLNLCGMWLTPDHKVWSGTQWLEAQSLVQDANTRSQVLDTAVANLPLQATFADTGEALLRLSSNVTADPMSTAWTAITSKISKARAVRFVPKLRQTSNGTGCIRTQWATTDTEPDFSIDWLLPSQGVTAQPTKHTLTMEGVAYQCTSNGERIEPRFFTMYKRLKGGMSRALKWTGLMSTATTSPTTSDLYPEVKTLETNEKLQTSNRKSQTYDLAYAGPRNRYMVLTAQGPMIVHNCGYGMGGTKFQAQLKAFGVTVTEGEAAAIIKTYRETYPYIPALWQAGSTAISALANGQTARWGNGCVEIHKSGILMPNGLYQRYPNLRKMVDPQGKVQYVYDSRKGAVKLYGGKLTENICQGLARCIIGEQMLKIAKRYRVVLTVHDAVACVAPKQEAEEAKQYVMDCMRYVPDWAKGIPLNCEAGYGESYGDC